MNNGGTAEFALSSTPDTTWGARPEDAPPSFRDGEVGQRGYVEPGRLVIPAGTTGTVNIGAQDFSGQGATVRWGATPPPGIRMSPPGGDIVVPPGAKASVAVTVQVDPGVEQTTYQVPVSFTGPGGALQGGGFQVLVAEPGSLRAAFNNVGISPDDNMAVANFDLVGWSFSATALANAGVRPGGNVVVDGLSHVWPSVPVADPDNVIVGGQTLNLPAGPAGATRLALLGAAANGATSGDLVITYTDGSTQTERIGFSDWTVNGGGQPPSFDNRIVARMPYRNAVSGTPQQIVTYVFATAG